MPIALAKMIWSACAVIAGLAVLSSAILFGANRARAATLVSFASSTTISFPLADDGLAVEPVLLPFVPFVNVAPDLLGVLVSKATRDGRELPTEEFSAEIVSPVRDGLYAIRIDSTATGDARAIAAGKYEITVYLWQRPAPGEPASLPASPGGSTQGCSTICQAQAFTITRDAIQLDMTAASMLVRAGRFWLGRCGEKPGGYLEELVRTARVEFGWCRVESEVGTAMLFETGGKSAGRMLSLDATASHVEGGETLTVPVSLMTVPAAGIASVGTVTIGRGGARLVSFDTAGLHPGTWTTTLRFSSDQLAGGFLSKSITIVRKLSLFYLLAAIIVGIFMGQLVRVRLQQLQNDAVANSIAADLKVRLESLQSIQDETFATARRAAWQDIDTALGDHGRSPETITTVVRQVGTTIDTALEEYQKRRVEARQNLVLLRDAVKGLASDVPRLSLSPLLDSISGRLKMIDATLVSQAKAEEQKTKVLAIAAVAEIRGWLTDFSRNIGTIKTQWNQPADVPQALDDVANDATKLAATDVMANQDHLFWQSLATWIVGSTSLAIAFGAALDRVWFPRVEWQSNIISAAAGGAARQTLQAAVAALRTEVAFARTAGEPTQNLIVATTKAKANADAAVAAPARVPAGGPGAGTLAVARPPAVPSIAASVVTIAGPVRAVAGIEAAWSATTTDPADKITWLVDGLVATVASRELQWRFEADGLHTIEARVHGNATGKVQNIQVARNPARLSSIVWHARSRTYETLSKAAFAAIVAASGWAVLEGTFFGWRDVFIAFIWGFGMDLTLNVATELRTNAIRQRNL